MKAIYEIIMIVLVLITIITIWTENTYNSTINWIVWGIFFVDFVIRFLTAKEKWEFIKRNPFLIIAIIPFDQFFQIARVVRLIYFFRIKTIAKYYITPYIRKLSYQSVTLIFILILSILLIESVFLWKIEMAIDQYLDAVYVVFAHLLFFGHRMFVVEQSLSIWLLTITSILGVVVQGLALQWVFSKVEAIYRRLLKQKDSTRAS